MPDMIIMGRRAARPARGVVCNTNSSRSLAQLSAMLILRAAELRLEDARNVVGLCDKTELRLETEHHRVSYSLLLVLVSQ